MRALPNWLRSELSIWPGEAATHDADEAAFLARCQERFDRHSRIVVAIMLALALAWWPIEILVFHRIPQALTPELQWRLAAIAVCAIYLLLPKSLRGGQRALWLFSSGAIAGFVLTGYILGRVSGPELQWFHFCYVLSFTTVLLPLRLLPRLILTIALVLAPAAGFFIPFPLHRAAPSVALSFSMLLYNVALSIIFGHILFLLSRENFLQAQRLVRSGAQLESRVAEQTLELRQLLNHLDTAREDERTRVARDLHDELGQELSAMRYALSFTLERFERDPSAIRSNLTELEQLLDRTRETTRNLVAELRPRILDDLGLGAAAEWLVKRTEERTGLACKLILRGETSHLPRELSTAAFRILQESLTNVGRHAAASQVEAELTVSPEALELRVSDDGVGIAAARAKADAAQRADSSRMGLLGMRERAHALGGTLRVEGRVVGGTEVFCRLPLPAHAGLA